MSVGDVGFVRWLLDGDPLLVNEDPYERGWLIEIEPSRWEAEVADLISGEAIGPWALAESERLRAETSPNL